MELGGGARANLYAINICSEIRTIFKVLTKKCRDTYKNSNSCAICLVRSLSTFICARQSGVFCLFVCFSLNGRGKTYGCVSFVKPFVLPQCLHLIGKQQAKVSTVNFKESFFSWFRIIPHAQFYSPHKVPGLSDLTRRALSILRWTFLVGLPGIPYLRPGVLAPVWEPVTLSNVMMLPPGDIITSETSCMMLPGWGWVPPAASWMAGK